MSISGVLLGLLELGPAHGYDLKRRHDQHFGARRLALPQVYATLGRLERDGLVEQTETTRVAGPDRNVYAVTDRGVAQVGEWLGAAEDPSPALQSVVFSKVVLAVLSGRDAAGVLQTQQATHRALMRQLTAAKNDASLEQTLALDYALFHLDADLRWMRHTAARLDALTKELT